MKHEKAPVTGTIVLGALIAAIESDPALTERSRQDLLTALRSFCHHLGLDPNETEANFFSLRGALKGFHPRLKGITPKTWSNIRSLVTQAMNRYGAARRASLPVQLNEQWRVVRDSFAATGLVRSLSRFVNFCAERNIQPSTVIQQTFDDYLHFLEQGTLNRYPKKAHRLACVAWNRAVRALPELSLSAIAVPRYRDPVSLPLTTFPESFAEELVEWEAVVAGNHLFDDRSPRRPLRTST